MTAMRNAVSNTSVNIRALMEVSTTGAVGKLCASRATLAADEQLLCDLLHIEYGGTVSDLTSKFDAATLARVCGVCADKSADGFWQGILAKMRVLTLCSLTSETQLTLAELVKQLQVEDAGQAEEILIEAVMCKFVEAKIDHLTETVTIESSTQRTFDGAGEWIELSDRINLWIQNTNTVLQVIRSNTASFSSSFAPEQVF